MAWASTIDRGHGLFLWAEEVVTGVNTKEVRVSDLHRNARTGLDVLAVRIDYTATATSGARKLRIELRNAGADPYLTLDATNNISAGVSRIFQFGRGLPIDPQNVHREPLPEGLAFNKGNRLVFYDSMDIDATDTIKVRLLGRFL